MSDVKDEPGTAPPAEGGDAKGPPPQAPPALPPMGGGGGGGMPYPGYPPMMPPAPGPGGFGFPPMGMPMGGGFPPMMGPPYGGGGFGAPMSGGGGTAPKKSEGSMAICTVHPPGLPRMFDVSFPERKLAVCDRCKKNYRSRELCRSRDEHKALPWQTTYVVVTLTDEVLEKDEDGELVYADIPVVAELQQMPELCRGPGDGFMANEPICKVCKEKNYTRDYCRNTSKHTTPPYQAIYVKLVPKDPNETRPLKRKKRRQEENADGKPRPPDENAILEEDLSDDLTKIHESKTFFAAISSKKITVKWCEQIQYPEVSPSEASQPAAASGQSMMPPHMAQNNMQMQSQLWEAFRAGAMWAQSQQGHQMQMPMPGGGQMPGPGYGHEGKYAPPGPNNGNVKSPMV